MNTWAKSSVIRLKFIFPPSAFPFPLYALPPSSRFRCFRRLEHGRGRSAFDGGGRGRALHAAILRLGRADAFAWDTFRSMPIVASTRPAADALAFAGPAAAGRSCTIGKSPTVSPSRRPQVGRKNTSRSTRPFMPRSSKCSPHGGFPAALCQPVGSRRDRVQPFLCFQRRAPGDVLVGEVKIAGSAQRRYRGAVVQHGSILLERSASAPELPGLNDLDGGTLAQDDLVECLAAKTGRKVGFRISARRFIRFRTAAVPPNWSRRKYGSDGWNRHRGRLDE